MAGIIGIIASLTVLGLSLVITRLATVSLNLTGLSWETAKFQARSAFLLTSPVWVKLVLLALLGFFNAGWYSVLMAQLYSAMPGRSGTVMTVSNVFGLVGGLIPLGLGLAAERFGLEVTMWFLLLGPIALLMGVPGSRRWSLS